MTAPAAIRLRGVREHNLAGIDVEIPHGRLTVVTGVSGSGKSSLVFDTLHAACERRYLETLSGHARQFLQRLPTPQLAAAEGLSPSIALSQRRGGDHARSTVGTLSGMHDLLRFWFARRTGNEARDFSFVSAGACGECRGIGSVDEVARDLLVADENRTLRAGALVPTTPTGYIVYSQVTVDALDTVCRAHGFDVDTPWRDLTAEQRDVVFFGSDRVEVPFGKHSLASRMRWEGIKAKPRELGHYKGLIPTITDILRKSRNENALRFARSVPCPKCAGSRLAPLAHRARIDGTSIVDAARMPLDELRRWCERFPDDEARRLLRRLQVYERLGLRHLSCERATSSLSGGEHQRLRLGAIATDGLAGVTFVFDEPSIGLHASEERAVLDLLRELRDAGNTVVVVEHSEQALRAADHVVDLGPGPGRQGGEVLFAGPPAKLADEADRRSQTRRSFASTDAALPVANRRPTSDRDATLAVLGATANNLQAIDVAFAPGRLNVVSGVAGAGKSTLVADVLAAAVRNHLDSRRLPGGVRELRGADAIDQLVHVDQSPIGRTPRSNPATYTGMFDEIRKCFANEPLARERGFRATTFSFNTKDGGRCPECEGSGREVVGMHGLPSVELTCAGCAGRRFADGVLDVRYRGGPSILDVLDATVDDARTSFAEVAKVDRVLAALQQVGLGYLTLGQPATTLSGGEAQRVRLAGELARGGRKRTLFVLEEPTIGLHRADVAQLLGALGSLVDDGHTVVLVEHDLDVLRAADRILDLGPGAGPDGGRVCGVGTADDLARLDTPTGIALRTAGEPAPTPPPPPRRPDAIRLRGAATHNLQELDVDIPAAAFTVVTGVSGSGKSSLVHDTLFGESRARFTEHLSGHLQRQLGSGGVRARSLRSAEGLRPAIALEQRAAAETIVDRRATVATTAELHPLLRTLFSRLGPPEHTAACYSWFRREGACATCAGTGTVQRCDPERLIVDPSAPLFDGALDVRNKVLRDYADRSQRHRSLLEAVGKARGHDYADAWCELDQRARDDALFGCGERTFDAVWEHTGAEGGEPHRFTAPWPGIAGDVEREFARRQASGAKTARQDFAALMHERPCAACDGQRLAEPMRSTRVGGHTLPALCALTIDALATCLADDFALGERQRQVAAEGIGELQRRLVRLAELGLGHLHLDRVTATLSSGERQRLRLARQLAAPLHGCVYVLDEPTLGLHARDTEAVLATIRGLVAAGNAVVAVEHDLALVAAADHVLEIGPGPGPDGGRLVACGSPSSLPETSRTGRNLRTPPGGLRSAPRNPASGALTIEGASLHNLQGFDVSFPAGQLTAVTGVSGCGKSTLVRGVLGASLRAQRPVGCRAVHGGSAFAAIVDDAGGRSARRHDRCVLDWLEAFEPLRKQFAATGLARERRLRANHFSPSAKNGGACRSCRGLGEVRTEFDFLGADSWLPCEPCAGRRFDDDTLAVRWLDLSIADVLAGTAAQLLAKLDASSTRAPKLTKPLRVACELGLGYLRLGQSAATLSGGEAQRLTLAQHLASGARGSTLFLLDEPTRGLHPDDVAQLLLAFEQLLANGDTILAIEHDLQVIAAADHVVDLGPGTGARGGRIGFEGTPARLATQADSATGAALV